jgi:signal transduction histidine kinase
MSRNDFVNPILAAQKGGDAQTILMEMLFDRMPMGIMIMDRNFVIQRFNLTWAEFAIKYAPPSGKPLTPGAQYFEVLPGSEESSLALFNLVLEGETVRKDALRFETEGVVSYWDASLTPLTHDGEVIGILNVTNDATERVMLQLNLEQRVEERTLEIERRRKVAESMRDIVRMINTNMPLEKFLDAAVELAAEQMGAGGCILHEFNIKERTIFYHACYGMENITEKHTLRKEEEFKASGTDRYFEATLRRQPTYGNYSMYSDRGKSLILNDPTIPDQAKERRIRLRDRFAGVLSVPLFIQNRPWGGMLFYYTEPQEFSQEQIDLGMTFADQVAIAIENTRLLEEAEKAAINEERNRLARDLHDAVTQTLFSSSLIADVLPRIWERNAEEGQRRLEELRQLTRGALSEMRTLLVELRPSAMQDTDLGDLIAHLVNAFIAKSRVSVDFTRSSTKVAPPPEVKEMFYRVAQENFNNIAKHAKANIVIVELTSQAEVTALVIRDDGVGFDSSNPQHVGFGLKIMRERAQSVGAHFNIQSTPGSGTIVTVTWQHPDAKEQNHE